MCVSALMAGYWNPLSRFNVLSRSIIDNILSVGIAFRWPKPMVTSFILFYEKQKHVKRSAEGSYIRDKLLFPSITGELCMMCLEGSGVCGHVATWTLSHVNSRIGKSSTAYH